MPSEKCKNVTQSKVSTEMQQARSFEALLYVDVASRLRWIQVSLKQQQQREREQFSIQLLNISSFDREVQDVEWKPIQSTTNVGVWAY